MATPVTNDESALAKNATALSKGSPQTSHVVPDQQVTVTATATTGYLFSHWTALPTETSVNGNVISFAMPDEDVPGLTAHFIANPFLAPELEPGVPNPLGAAAVGAKPVFQGLLLPGPQSEKTNATVGLFTATLVASKGSLSGKVFMDGEDTSYTGVLQAGGDRKVWFRVDGALKNKLKLKGAVEDRTLSATWSEDGLLATVSVLSGVVSTGLAKPKPARVPDDLLLPPRNQQGYYTLALFPRAPDPAFPEDAALYPQGTGYATLTLTRTGTVKVVAVLADGTKISGGGVLVTGNKSPIFIQLRTPGGRASEKGGSFSGDLVFTPATTEVNGDGWCWFRPVAKTESGEVQAYRAGWPDGIRVDLKGALYDLAGTTVRESLGLDLLNPVDPNAHNAELIFREGKLAAEEGVKVTAFNIDGNEVVKLGPKNTSFSLSITAKTGLMKGTFTPEGGWSGNGPDGFPLVQAQKLPEFRGVLLQKNGTQGGFGFFLSNAAGDPDPESGAVTLSKP